MSTTLEAPAPTVTAIEIDDIVITDEDLLDVQLRGRIDVGH